MTLDILKEIVIGDLGSKTSARDKKNDVSGKKNTTGLVQDDRELVKKGEKEKVLEV